MTVVNSQARLFVMAVISRYDMLCHCNTAKMPDIFNPGFEEGLKDNSLDYFLERFSNPPQVAESDPPRQMTYAELNAEVVTQYKEHAPTLSHLFALAGILDAPSQDPDRQNIQSHIIEVLIDDHLRNKQDYAKDPMSSATNRSHFYSQIFPEAYSGSSTETKEEIIDALKKIQPQFKDELESYSSRLQRLVFKIEGAFNRIITNDVIKIGLSIALGIGSYFAVYKVIAISGVFFNSAIFARISSGVVSYMPVLVVQISSGAYNGLVGVVAYVASTRLYGYLYLEKLVPLLLSIKPFVTKFALRVQATCYQWAFGPSAQVQMAIAKSLKVCPDPNVAKELLEGGMKAYQIWMYLVEQGPQKGFFKCD